MHTHTAEWIARARKVVPGGANTLSKRPGVAGPEGDVYPAVAVSQWQGHVTDVDGRTFTDWTSGLGATMFGEGAYSLPHTSEIELSERLAALLPGAEQVKLFSSGTEACMCAMATARAVTGRTVILTSDQSYHGWSDQARAMKPEHPGVPEPMCDWIQAFRYNDIEDLKRKLHNDVAAVMMEPALAEAPKTGFLEDVKDYAHAHGALLIWDEMLLGFRLAIGGGSEYFGVTPDLATYGKPIGFGMPLAALVGAERYMRHAVFGSGTFCGHAASCEAALQAVARYEQGDVIPRVHAVGQRLKEGIARAIQASGAPLEITGFNVLPLLRWTVPDAELLLQSLLQQELAKRGVMIHASGRLLPTVAHDDACISQTAYAFQQALEVVARAHGAGTVRQALRCEPVRQAGIRKPAWEIPA